MLEEGETRESCQFQGLPEAFALFTSELKEFPCVSISNWFLTFHLKELPPRQRFNFEEIAVHCSCINNEQKVLVGVETSVPEECPYHTGQRESSEGSSQLRDTKDYWQPPEARTGYGINSSGASVSSSLLILSCHTSGPQNCGKIAFCWKSYPKYTISYKSAWK